MSSILILLLSLIVAGCVGPSRIARTPPPWTISQDVVLHKLTKNFVDIETSPKNVWISCTGEDHQDNVAFMGMHVLDGENTWTFFYRKPLSISGCKQEELEFRRIAKGAKTIRIVGIHPLKEDGPERKHPAIPERFTNVKKIIAAPFIRLQSGVECKAYFEEHCELPKNYWAGTIPNDY